MLALIDDWGNPSPGGRGTEWFGFAALLLRSSQLNEIRQCYQTVCECLGCQPNTSLHALKLDFNSKYHITRLLAAANPTVSIIAVRIHAVTSQHLTQRGWAYRYYGKEMVRVATHYAADCEESAQVIFHRHKYLENIEDYIFKKLRYNTWYTQKRLSQQILYDRLLDLRSLDDEDEALLCLADCVAHACHMALNPDRRWRQVNPTCLNLLTDCIWQGPSYDRNARLFGVLLEPGGIPVHMTLSFPDAIRRYWE